MSAPHQDKRIEAGVDKLVDVVRSALPATIRHVVDLASVRFDLVDGARAALLELLAAFNADTSAHVKAPHVDVHVHRPAPPHDAEDPGASPSTLRP